MIIIVEFVVSVFVSVGPNPKIPWAVCRIEILVALQAALPAWILKAIGANLALWFVETVYLAEPSC